MARQRNTPQITEQLHGTTEPWLVRLYALHFEKVIPGVNGRDHMAQLIGRSVRSMDAVMTGGAFLSVDEWSKIQVASGNNWFALWLRDNYPSLSPNGANHND